MDFLESRRGCLEDVSGTTPLRGKTQKLQLLISVEGIYNINMRAECMPRNMEMTIPEVR